MCVCVCVGEDGGHFCLPAVKVSAFDKASLCRCRSRCDRCCCCHLWAFCNAISFLSLTREASFSFRYCALVNKPPIARSMSEGFSFLSLSGELSSSVLLDHPPVAAIFVLLSNPVLLLATCRPWHLCRTKYYYASKTIVLYKIPRNEELTGIFATNFLL